MKNKKGFTLVELLAVIVILAIILVIAVPKILTVIDDTRIESMKSSALMIIDSAEREYSTRVALGQSTTMACTDVASISAADYILPVDATKECALTFNTTTGAATLRLYGKTGGKFAGKCIAAGTRGSITVATTGC